MDGIEISIAWREEEEDTFKIFVKMGSVTAEIFLIWTNVTWINVVLIVGICCRCSSFIKMGSVTAEIFLIWTNVTWTNVNLIVGTSWG